MQQKNVIVVGMARSGTSLTASIFGHNGYFVADDPDRQLPTASRYNPSGYWELDQLIDANVRILEAVGFDFHNTWNKGEILERQANAILTLEQTESDKKLARYFSGHQPWVWKDPRFCYTLAYWWPLMDPQQTRVLLVTRNPEHIWRSFLRTKWRGDGSGSKKEFFQRIENHLLFLRRTIDKFNIPYLEVDYADYARMPRETAQRLGDYFGLELSASDLGYKNKYNTSSPRGYLGYSAEKAAAILPDSFRVQLKKAMPGSIRKALFPARPE